MGIFLFSKTFSNKIFSCVNLFHGNSIFIWHVYYQNFKKYTKDSQHPKNLIPEFSSYDSNKKISVNKSIHGPRGYKAVQEQSHFAVFWTLVLCIYSNQQWTVLFICLCIIELAKESNQDSFIRLAHCQESSTNSLLCKSSYLVIVTQDKFQIKTFCPFRYITHSAVWCQLATKTGSVSSHTCSPVSLCAFTTSLMSTFHVNRCHARPETVFAMWASNISSSLHVTFLSWKEVKFWYVTSGLSHPVPHAWGHFPV